MFCRSRICLGPYSYKILGAPSGVSLHTGDAFPEGDYDLISWTQWQNHPPHLLEWLNRLDPDTHVWLWMGEFLNDWQVFELLEGIRARPVHVFCDNIWESTPHNVTTMINWWTWPENLYAPDGRCHHLLSQLTDTNDRPWLFDCLLGTQRLHRDLIAQWWERSAHRDRFRFSYYREHTRQGYYDASVWFETDAVSGLDVAWTWQGDTQIASQFVLPVDIYNRSYYSIVAETGDDFTNSFYVPTEKVGRPLVARRPFVMFAGPGDLALLRSLGFRTFHPIIDESYDSIDDNHARWQAAWQQVEWLCTQDPRDVMQELAPVLDHNQQLMIHTDWFAPLRQRFDDFVKPYQPLLNRLGLAK